MANTSAASGTQSATLTTEHTLATITTIGTYQLNVDTTNLVNGETLTLRAKTKTLSGGASGLAYEAVYKHAQGDVQKFSVPIAILIEVVFTLRQDGGTGRAFPWNVVAFG